MRLISLYFFRYACESCGFADSSISIVRRHIATAHSEIDKILVKCLDPSPDIETWVQAVVEQQNSILNTTKTKSPAKMQQCQYCSYR